jgi:hypothetical protein
MQGFPKLRRRTTGHAQGTLLHQQIRQSQEQDPQLANVKSYLNGIQRSFSADYQSLQARVTLQEDLIMVDGNRVLIGADSALQTRLLERYHNSCIDFHKLTNVIVKHVIHKLLESPGGAC